MTNHFDYNGKILIAVEVANQATLLTDKLNNYFVFRKLAIEEIKEAFKQTQNILVRLFGADRFDALLERRINYWEKLESTNVTCFVHYAYGSEDEINELYNSLPSDACIFAGIYHIVPQVSAFPYAFPVGDVPNPWYLGVPRGFTDYSVYWFNFFPPQNFLLEKIYRVYVSFAAIKARLGAECNQLVEIDDIANLFTKGVDQFVDVNLTRFTNYDGFFHGAMQAGRHSFIPDEDFTWYGMLLKMVT